MVGNNLGFTWVQPGDIWRPLGWDLGFIWFHKGFSNWRHRLDMIRSCLWLWRTPRQNGPDSSTMTHPNGLPTRSERMYLLDDSELLGSPHVLWCFMKAELVESAQLGFQECRATLSTITLTTLIWRFASNFRSKTFAVTISTCFDWNLLMGHALSTSSIHIFAMLCNLGQMSWSEKMPNWSAKFWSSNFRR